MSANLACLEALARAAGSSPTLKVAWRRLWEALPSSWGVVRLDLVAHVAGNDEAHTLSVGAQGPAQSWSSAKPLAGSFAARVFCSSDLLLHEAASSSLRFEIGAVDLAGFKLEIARQPERCVIMHLSRPLSSLELQPEFVRVLVRLFEATVAHVDLIERLAQLSQRTHQERSHLRQELERLTERPNIVAESVAMRDVVSVAEQVAKHDISVVILGESGTGKELIARHIHELSHRRDGPFVAVNCGALPEALIESELFGHEKGAFTGATTRRIGRFELAHRGTLFLDEVGDLPLASQVKLLRVLQERVVQRVGAERTIDVDVRVIAATHRHLESMVAAKTFRADLYYRLRGVPIEIPPLRERPEDIAGIVRTRLAHLCRRMKRPLPRVSQGTLAALCAAPWPGNVRELENALERALILSPGDQPQIQAPANWSAALPVQPQVETFRDASRRSILAALEAAHGKIYGRGGAAERLGLKPSTLQTKMEKLGISRRPPRSADR